MADISITSWIQAIGVILGVPTAVWGILKLFRKDKERERVINEMRSQLKEFQDQRLADMAWRLYEFYSLPEMTESRDILYQIRGTFSTYKEYQQKYHNKEEGSPEKEKDKKVRRRVEFFHQVGLLLNRRLVDRNLLLGLIGSAFKQDREMLEMVVKSSRDFHNDDPTMYEYFYELGKEYEKWENSGQPITSS